MISSGFTVAASMGCFRCKVEASEEMVKNGSITEVRFQRVRYPSVDAVSITSDESRRMNCASVKQLLVYVPLANSVKLFSLAEEV